MQKEKTISLIENNKQNKVKVAIADIDGILRGKIMHKEKFLSAVKSGFGFCDVIFGWDAMDVAYDNADITGWHTGYPDAQTRIDLLTYREIPWQDNMPFFLADFSNPDDKDLASCPRSLLKKIDNQCRKMGFVPFFSQEFEWFNFQENPDQLHQENYCNPKPLTPGMFGYSILRSSQRSDYFNALFDLLEQFNIPLEGLHTETGPGVYEAAIQYAEILEAGDRAVLFKTAVKEIAYCHNIIASFMAKWNVDLPGCSGHIHQSLWNEDKTANLFYDKNDDNHISDLMKSYIAGQLKCLPEILPMYAPTINSYKRLVEGAWAPTTLTWAIDNRTTALRVLNTGEKSARLETRVVGSDVNPYLAMAACLASGLYGIANKLKLDVPQTSGNGYLDKKNGCLPSSLKEATEKMKKSKIAGELFGDEFVNHFTQTREWECRQFAKQVTDWEMKRYFEII